MNRTNQKNKAFNEELLKLFPNMGKEWGEFLDFGSEADEGDIVVFEDVLCPYVFRMLRERNEDELFKICRYISELATVSNAHQDAAIFFIRAVRGLPGWSLLTKYFTEMGKEIFLSDENGCGPDEFDKLGIYDPNTYFDIIEKKTP